MSATQTDPSPQQELVLQHVARPGAVVHGTHEGRSGGGDPAVVREIRDDLPQDAVQPLPVLIKKVAESAIALTGKEACTHFVQLAIQT